MQKIHATLTFAAASLAVASLAACAAPPPSTPSPDASAALAPYPATLPAMQRYVIELPALADENDHKLELIAGKAMTVDCNSRHLNGRFEEQTVQGWGYPYWEFKSNGQAISTLMACPPGSEKPGFVAGTPLLVRYNSKLPVVVFVPDGMALRYRVWQAGATQAAQQK